MFPFQKVNLVNKNNPKSYMLLNIFIFIRIEIYPLTIRHHLAT